MEGWKSKLRRRIAVVVARGEGTVRGVVEDLVLSAGSKWSYRFNVWIILRTILVENGYPRRPWWKKLENRIQLMLLWEDPKQAPILTSGQLKALAREEDPNFALVNALILPSGMRFADAARIRSRDVIFFREGLACIRIRQTKTIRKRKDQRWLCLQIPAPLQKVFKKTRKECQPSEPLVKVTYSRYLHYLKRKLGPSVATYSLRRTVINLMASRVQTIGQLQQVTLHRTEEQLRWYLEAPLPDELKIQAHATAWHQGMFAL